MKSFFILQTSLHQVDFDNFCLLLQHNFVKIDQKLDFDQIALGLKIVIWWIIVFFPISSANFSCSSESTALLHESLVTEPKREDGSEQ